MCLVTFATGLSILNINVYHRGERGNPISKTLKRIVNILSGVFPFSRINNSSNEKVIKIFWKNQVSTVGVTFPNYHPNLSQRRLLQVGNISRKYSKADDNAERLTRDLFSNYDVNIRAAVKFSKSTAVNFTLFLHSLIEVDEKKQILVTDSWILAEWVDYRLQWNVSEYGGLKSLMIPSENIWKPDIKLHNTANRKSNSMQIATFANVSNKGEISFYQQGIFYTYCKMDISYFPFDTQTCSLLWESWSYDSTEIELTPQKKVGLVLYEDSGEFEVTYFKSSKRLVLNGSKYYWVAEYTLRLRRRPLAYVFNLIIPCGLINAVALLVFYMPSQTGEKVTLGINCLVSMTVFLINIKDSLPSTGTISIISEYFLLYYLGEEIVE
ncbi:neuronal acetylcholine receptor subunit alpha-3-like [Agrilus planipennis]|uniref:Neuronal acetylcholine receptor subunit alpha-3-like n=1 Tax=Agrilus planipennis TaxID=224129 RepID=A0A7F5R752_AGRPL|nr:neuronal acetylcholine receptor subunit alpha-3-like [Agrilus planipennis]